MTKKFNFTAHYLLWVTGSRAGRQRSAEWSLGFTSPPRIASRFCKCGYFALLPNPALSRIPVQSVSMRGHGTMLCWPPAGHPDPSTGLHEKNLDLILKSASLFYQIICVMCHIMHLRYCTQDYRTQISKVPSMQRCALRVIVWIVYHLYHLAVIQR